MKGSEYQFLQEGGGGARYINLKKNFSVLPLYNRVLII